MYCYRASRLELCDELRNDFLVELMRAVDIVPTRHYNWKTKRTKKRHSQNFGTCFRSSVRIHRAQTSGFIKLNPVCHTAFAIHFISTTMHKSTNVAFTRSLQKRGSAYNIVFRKLPRTARLEG